MALRRLKKELDDFEKEPPSRISVEPGCSPTAIYNSQMHRNWLKENPEFLKWKATIAGSDNTPYSGGTWHMTIELKHDYPFKPPKVRWNTPIFHCNLSGEKNNNCPCCGLTCLSELKDNWSPALTVSKILWLLRDLLDHPDPSRVGDGIAISGAPYIEARKLFVSDRNAHDMKAREWTLRYGDDMGILKGLITDGYLRDILSVYSIQLPNGVGSVIKKYFA